MRLLILGGTSGAALLAGGLAGRAGGAAILSRAGRTQAPLKQAIATRIGGFGGIDGLVDYLRANGIGRVIDATHPFAAQMSRPPVGGRARAPPFHCSSSRARRGARAKATTGPKRRPMRRLSRRWGARRAASSSPSAASASPLSHGLPRISIFSARSIPPPPPPPSRTPPTRSLAPPRRGGGGGGGRADARRADRRHRQQEQRRRRDRGQARSRAAPAHSRRADRAAAVDRRGRDARSRRGARLCDGSYAIRLVASATPIPSPL